MTLIRGDKNVLKCLFIIILYLVGFPSDAQEPYFYKADLGQGFRLNFSVGILQDPSGKIWFGSKEGLFCYNGGGNLINYNPSNRKYYIPIPNIQGLVQDTTRGLLIFHNNKEIYQLDPRKNVSQLIPFKKPVEKRGGRQVFLTLVDPDGVLWVAVWQIKVDKNGYVFHLYQSKDLKALTPVLTLRSTAHWIRSYASFANGHLYINFENAVLMIDKSGSVVRKYTFPKGSPGGHCWDKHGTLWVISHVAIDVTSQFKHENLSDRGIYFLKKGSDVFTRFHLEDIRLITLCDQLMVEDKRIITYGVNLSIIDLKSGRGKNYNKDISRIDNYAYESKTRVNKMLKDFSGVYWLCGVDIFKMEDPPPIDHYLQGGSSICNGYKCPVRKITEDEAGNIIFGVSHQVVKLNPETGSFEIPFNRPDQKFKPWEPWGLTPKGNILFVDNAKFDYQDGSLSFVFGDYWIRGFNACDQDGKIWFGREHAELYIYDPDAQQTRKFDALKSVVGPRRLIKHFFPQRSGPGMWVVVENEGLFLVDKGKGVLAQYRYDPNDENTLLSNQIQDAAEDESGNMWIASSMGLSKLDLRNNTFTHYTVEDGLPSPQIWSVLTEKDQGVWLGTSYGLSFFDRASRRFFNFSQKDGLVNTEYNSFAAYRSRKGKLYFGGLDGIDAFYPDVLLKPAFEGTIPIVVTQMDVFNQSLEQTTSLDLAGKEVIELEAGNKFFKLYFQAADYRANADNLYSYKMDGYDANWSMPSRQNDLRYENLPPGKYRLRVRVSVSPTVWSAKELSFQVIKRKFWYETYWAYGAFLFLFLAGTYFIYRYWLNRRLEQEESRRLRDLDALKTRLYTNITHEFRTPLTVILGMTDELEKNLSVARKLIRRNARNLLRLVNQMLDLSKLESGKLKINWQHGDIIGYLQYLLEAFQSYAAGKNIALSFHTEQASLRMIYDVEKIQHIIANLLSNAIKFTPQQGSVRFEVSTREAGIAGRELLIRIKDTGVGIPLEHQDRIFDRFYQADDSHTRKGEGTGIGLALTRELVVLLGGSISVQSTPGVGSEFLVVLPVQTAAEVNDAVETADLPRTDDLAESLGLVAAPLPEDYVPAAAKNAQEHSEQPLLLIIEDNADVAGYIRSCLESEYEVQWAADGQAGIDQALEIIPDVIVCDVMMPEKDGFEVTEFLKNDERTSHIPIVLLTAKADVESKIAGLRRGADAYLAKPFDKAELLARLANLVELRRKLQARYANPELLTTLTKAEPADPELQLEDEFLKKVNAILEQHLSDADYDVPQLSRALHMSRPQLYRKVKALTDRSIVSYMRLLRLMRAKELLQNTETSISEVAYEVGFTDPAYFSRAFSEEFGVAPRDVRSG